MRLFANVVLSLTALFLLLPAAAQAQQVINACVKENGAMRIVSDSAECRAREAPLSWNREGPQGAPGEPGTPGESGPQGPPGSFRVIDATGQDIGVYVGRDLDPPHWFFVYSEELQTTYEVAPQTGDRSPTVFQQYFPLRRSRLPGPGVFIGYRNAYTSEPRRQHDIRRDVEQSH